MEQSISVEIAAPAEQVWAVMSDLEAWPSWAPTVTSVRLLDDGPPQVGSRAKIAQPKLPQTEYTITALVPGRSFTWEATGPGVRTIARHQIEPLGPDRSRVRLSVTQSGWLGSVMGRFYRGLTDRYLAAEAEGLRARCERPAAG